MSLDLVAAEALLVARTASARLERAVRVEINSDLNRAGMDGNRSFASIGQGLIAIGNVLSKHGIEWDETLNAHLFMGDSGTRTLRIAFSNQTDPFSPSSISNSLIRLGWYKRESGNYEITAYVS